MIKDLFLLRTQTEWELNMSNGKKYILVSDVDELCSMDDYNTPEDCTSYTIIDSKTGKELTKDSTLYNQIKNEAIVEIDKFIYGEYDEEEEEEEEEEYDEDEEDDFYEEDESKKD